MRVGGEELVVISYAAPDVGDAPLTRTEREVAMALVQGKSRRAIAAERRRAPATIARQVESIYAKLAVTSRAELVARLIGRGRE